MLSLPDALLTDLELPGMSGLDLIRAVRRRADRQSLRIVMPTASDAAEDEGPRERSAATASF